MPVAAPSRKSVERFAQLFAGRTDARGTYTLGKDGLEEYVAKRESITIDHYRRHLDGETLGIYPLQDDGTCVWGCFDFDRDIIEEAVRCKQLLQTYGIAAYIETSKRKGHHVWIFWSAPVDAAHLRQVMKLVLRNAGCDPSTEIFPKADRIRPTSDNPLGSLVNLPFPGNGTAGRRVVLDDSLVEMTFEEWIAVAVQNDPALLRRIIPVPAPPDDGRRRVLTTSSPTPGYTGPDLPCIRAALAVPTNSGHRHAVGLRLAQYWTHTRKYDADAVWEALQQWNQTNDPPLSEGDLSDCMKGITDSPTCTWLRKEPVFRDACTWQACTFYRPTDDERPKTAQTLVPLTVAQEPQGMSRSIFDSPEAAESERQMVAKLCQVGFIGGFTDWMRASTDAPALYHCLAAIACIAASVGNAVSANSFGNSVVRPNVWISIIAPSGINRKSTALDGASSLLGHYAEMLDRLLPHDFTSKAFIDHLAENPAGLLVIDELAGFLQGMRQKYQAGTTLLLTKLYEGGSHTVTRVGSGTTSVHNAAISILGASTKHMLQADLDMKDFSNGFLARMLFVPGQVKEVWKGLRSVKPDPRKPDELAAALRQFRLYNGVVSFDAVVDRFDEWNQAYERTVNAADILDTQIGLVSRAGKLVQKFAMLFQIGASMRDQGGKGSWGTIEPWALELAIEFVEWTIKRQVKFMYDEMAFSPTGRDRQLFLEYLKKHGGSVTRTEMSRNTHLQSKQLDVVADAAEEAGYIETDSVPPAGGRGRPTVIYRLVLEKKSA